MMVGKVELIPIDEGNRIIVKQDEKVIIGRGSSLGCNDKKISRHHAELLLKDDNTLWITPTHANPVFFRPPYGKTIQLPKNIERELKDGDQIGLLPSTFYFRVSFSIDYNNNNGDSDTDSVYEFKKEAEEVSPIRQKPSDDWSPTPDYRRSTSNQDISVFDFDDDINTQPATRIPCRRVSLEKKLTLDVEPKPKLKSPTKTPPPSSPSPTTTCSPSITIPRVSITHPPAEAQDESDSCNTNIKARKLPKWMLAPSSSPIVKPTTTPKSSYSRNSSYTAPTSAKRHLSFEGESNDDMNELSNMSDTRSSTEGKSPGKVLSKIQARKSCDSDSADGLDSVTIRTTPPAPKRIRSGGKRRPACQFGASCYRKNPAHRAELSHPGDSDYDDSKQSIDTDDNDPDRPDCPFGKSCYRQNPQHKRDFRH
ncbi:unnamed protein product [Adineta ricciae]|uniref:Aprataxin and PNK-like factor n=1 Tax=Adineta ricciae TaxID=249248 RepID=A0A813YGR3_ADIRI|nr:unnamed protein product [Adineta ricciae]